MYVLFHTYSLLQLYPIFPLFHLQKFPISSICVPLSSTGVSYCPDANTLNILSFKSQAFYSLSFIIKLIQHMAKKTNNDEELRISEFIKEPASLKLLILAGTNIRPTQLPTIAKCTGLIKLDLSNNFLKDIQLKFSAFPHLKILYLHDNQIFKIDITKTSLEYVSLFSNPIKQQEYRLQLINTNKSILAIDKNVVCQKQRIQAITRNLTFESPLSQINQNIKLPLFTELKWPIVQISASLEHEDDYLNLLKAEIFVINNVAKRTNKIEFIEKIFKGVIEQNNFNLIKEKGGPEGGVNRRRWVYALKAAKKWKEYTRLRKKLRLILAKKGKQDLLMNRLQIIRKNRSPGMALVMQTFMPLMRKKMNARGVFERNIHAFRKYIPTKKSLYENYLDFKEDRDLLTNPIKFYFRDSQYEILSKITLYAKKMLFQQKQYDLCDQFSQLFKLTNNRYFIFRGKEPYEHERSWLLNSIHETARLVLRKCGVDRKHFLYTRKGHKKITVKSISKPLNPKFYEERMQACDRKLQYIEDKYDKLIEYEVKNHKVLQMMLKIIRYISAGNASTVVLTETAYFQTQIDVEKEEKKTERVKFFVGLEFFIKRILAANTIQRFWRKKMAQKRNKIKIIQSINKKRAKKLINRWFSNIIFHHRMVATQTNSYFSSIWKKSEVYFHLDVYMNIPEPTNFLRFPRFLNTKDQFYQLFHTKTQVQIVEATGRKWVKINFNNEKKAAEAQKKLFQNTYRYYYNGFSLKFFTNQEIKDEGYLCLYEERVKNLFNIKIEVTKILDKASVLWVDNLAPYFIWSEMELQSTKIIFSEYEKNSTNVSIFIYNKHKRPLKVSCQIFWVKPQSIYLRQRRIKSISQTGNPSMIPSEIRSHQNSLILRGKQGNKLTNLDQSMKKEYRVDLPFRKSKNHDKSLRSSSKKSNSLIRSHRTRIVSDPRHQLLSQTLNIRRK